MNIHAPNTGAPEYLTGTRRQRKGEKSSNVVLLGDFNTALSIPESSAREKMENFQIENGIVIQQP